MARRHKGFGAYAVRDASASTKSKWKVEIKKTAREAVKRAKALSLAQSKTSGRATIAPPVCVFDMSRWERRPVCFQYGKRVGYSAARSSAVLHKGVKLRRLALDRSKMPIVKED